MTQVGAWRRFAFLPALVFGILLYLATQSAVAGVIVPTLVAGWNSLDSGLWLFRTDWNRPRANACLQFYLATACWKSAAAALFTVVSFVITKHLTGDDPGLDQFAALMIVLIAGVVLSVLIGLASVIHAVKRRIRVWVHPRIRLKARGDFESLGSDLRVVDGFNHAIFIVATSLVVPPLLFGSSALVLVVGGDNPNNVDPTSFVVAFGVFLSGPIVMIPVYAWCSARIIAKTPNECWGVQAENPDEDTFAPGRNA